MQSSLEPAESYSLLLQLMKLLFDVQSFQVGLQQTNSGQRYNLQKIVSFRLELNEKFVGLPMRVDLGNFVKLVFSKWTNYLMSLEVLSDKTMSSTLNKQLVPQSELQKCLILKGMQQILREKVRNRYRLRYFLVAQTAHKFIRSIFLGYRQFTKICIFELRRNADWKDNQAMEVQFSEKYQNIDYNIFINLSQSQLRNHNSYYQLALYCETRTIILKATDGLFRYIFQLKKVS